MRNVSRFRAAKIGDHATIRLEPRLDLELVARAVQLRQQGERDTKVHDGGGSPLRAIHMKLSSNKRHKCNGFVLLAQALPQYVCGGLSFACCLGPQTFCGSTGPLEKAAQDALGPYVQGIWVRSTFLRTVGYFIPNVVETQCLTDHQVIGVHTIDLMQLHVPRA